MTSTNINTTGTRRKKRPLTSSRHVSATNNKTPAIPNNLLSKSQSKKKKRRVLNQPSPAVALSSFSSQQPTDSSLSITTPTPATPKSTAPSVPVTKRSIRAASEAISKREKQRQDAPITPSPPPPAVAPASATTSIEEKQPIVKRKRKLNSQKVVIPTNDSSPDALVFEETGDVRYAKYLDSPSTKQIPNNKKPSIVIGVPTKKRRLVRVPKPNAAVTTNTTTSTTSNASPPPPPPTLKAIKMIESSIGTTTTLTEDQEVLEPEQGLDLSQLSILPNSSYIGHLPVSQQQKNREKSTTTTASHSSEDPEESIMYTMDDYTANEKSPSPPSIFFDAISDFEDMTLNSQIHSEQEDQEMRPLESETNINVEKQEEIVIKQEQPSGSFSFWNSILKPFTKD